MHVTTVFFIFSKDTLLNLCFCLTTTIMKFKWLSVVIIIIIIIDVSLRCYAFRSNVNRINKNNELRLSLSREQQSLGTVAPSTQPSIQPSERPSSSQTPSINPSTSSSPSNSLSLAPSFDPTILPSSIPSTSSLPSIVPSTAPSINPSSTPSLQHSISPSYTLKNENIQDLEMIIEGMEFELESSIAQDDWRNITSHHVLQYWKKQQFDYVDVKTYIVRQEVVYIQQNTKFRNWRIESFTQFRNNNARKNNNYDGQLKIIYFQKFSLRNASIDSTLSLDPFARIEDRQDYIKALKKLTNDIFSSVSNMTVRVVNTDMPSMVPTTEPTKAQATDAPYIQPTRDEPIVQHNEAVIALSSILACLIILMICTAIWFIFIHNRNNLNSRFNDVFSRRSDYPEENDKMQQRSTSAEVGFLFPIKSDESYNDKTDEHNQIIADEQMNLSRSHEESHSIVSNLVSEDSSRSRSGHSRGSYEYIEESNLTSLLVEDDQAKE